jgi:WD40 repeat protein
LRDGRLAATAGKWNKTKNAWEGEIRIWDVTSGASTSLKGHSEQIESVAVSNDGKKLASAGDDHLALVWDLEHASVLHTLKGHKNGILSVAFSRDGSRLATASKDKTVRVWDALSGKELLVLKNPLPPQEKRASSESEDKKSKDKTKAASSNEQGKAKQKAGESKPAQASNDKKKESKDSPAFDTVREMTSVAFDPANDHIAASSLDGAVSIWGLAKGKKVRRLKTADGIWSIAYSPDGKRLAAAGWDKLIYVFDPADGKLLFAVRAHSEPIVSLAFSPDGVRLASASLDQTIRIWDMKKSRRRP